MSDADLWAAWARAGMLAAMLCWAALILGVLLAACWLGQREDDDE